MRPASAPTACRRCKSRPGPPVISMRNSCIGHCMSCRSPGSTLLFIENVGNLVCPASFDLGQHSQRHAAQRHRGRRQAGEIPRDLPRQRFGRAEQDGSARRTGGFRSGARGRRRCAPLGRDTPMIRTAARRAPAARPWLDWLEQANSTARRPVSPGSADDLRQDRARSVMHVPRRTGADRALLDDQWAETEVGGIRSRISIALIDGVAVGDYVIVHAGFAITRLDVEEAEKTLALFDEIAAHLERPCRCATSADSVTAPPRRRLRSCSAREVDPQARLLPDGILRRPYACHLPLRRRGPAARQCPSGARPGLPGLRAGGAAARCGHRARAAARDVTLVSYGDMLRVPASRRRQSAQGARAGRRRSHGVLGARGAG